MLKNMGLALFLFTLVGCQQTTNSSSEAATNEVKTTTTAMVSKDTDTIEKVVTSKEEQIVCSTTRPTGSMLKNKRCKTKKQIAAEQAEARDTVHRIHSSATGVIGTGGN